MDAVSSLDRAIEQIRSVADLYARHPENSNAEKKQFMQTGGRYEPCFEVETLGEDAYNEAKDLLDSARLHLESIGDTYGEEIRRLYHETLKEAGSYLAVARHIGDRPHLVKEASATIFGQPPGKTTEKAEKLLEDLSASPGARRYSAETMADAYRDVLDRFHLLDSYTVTFTDSSVTSVSEPNKTIQVPGDREYTENERKRLPLHEIGGHILRSENGYTQQFGIFGTGTAGFNTIEEGITTALETLTGNENSQLFKKYAARAIATESAIESKESFSDTFEKLTSHGIGSEMAWTVTERAYLWFRDHIYFDGYQRVQEFLERDGSLKQLYIGKIGGIDRAKELNKTDSVQTDPPYNPADMWTGLEQHW